MFCSSHLLKMKTKTGAQIFDKALKEYVVKEKKRVLCISIRGQEVIMGGEEDSVVLAKENMENMTLGEITRAMKEMEEVEDDFNFKSTEPVTFPPMKVKFKGKRWNIKTAREQLAVYMNIIGFGRGGSKQYGRADDEPEGWPDEHSFVALQGAGYASVKVASDIIESLLEYYGKDAKTHPYIEEEPKTPEKKSKKRKRAAQKDPVQVEEDIDPNDNSFAQDDANEGISRDNHGDNEAMSEYERIRRDNIKEIEELKRKVGLGSHSKEWDVWEDLS